MTLFNNYQYAKQRSGKVEEKKEKRRREKAEKTKKKNFD